MIFLGYNFLQDKYSWQPVPTNVTNIDNIQIKNGVYDYLNISKDIDFPYVTTYPTGWDLDTIFDADFNGNINAGNIDYVIGQISSIRVKKRKKGDFYWYTIFEVPINNETDVDFVRYDYLSQNDTEYEYAIVPILGATEGQYSVNSIESKFYGVFLTDNNQSYKFKENASYNSMQRVRKTGIYEPYGSKYPIIISNGILNYETGTVTGDVMVLTDNTDLDRKGTSDRLKLIQDFLSKPSAKILKDFNGNIWLVALSDNIDLSYYTEVGMGFAKVNFNWSEIGDSTDRNDLYDNNLIVLPN